MTGMIECEKLSAGKMPVETCIARQKSEDPYIKVACEGCEKGAEVMREHGNAEGEIKTERLSDGRLKTTGPCKECGETKRLIGSKNPICFACYDRGRKDKPKGPPRTKKGDGKPSPSIPPESCVFNVDLGAFGEVVERIREKAEKEMRTVEAQMAWELKQLFGEES